MTRDTTVPALPGMEGGAASRVSDALAAAPVDALWGELERRAAASPMDGPVDSPRKALAAIGDLGRKRKEHFVALYLDACHRVVRRETVSVGTLTASLVRPREVFGPAMRDGYAAVIVAHNHPSGDTTPSREDRETTRRLQEAGRILGIPVLDHLVVGSRGYFSFRERGLLDA